MKQAKGDDFVAKNFEIFLLLDFYGDMLTEKQRELAEMYYDEDMSLAEIAEHAKITRQGVRDAIKHAEESLLELEQKVGYAKRFRQISEGLDKIIAYSHTVQEQSRLGNFRVVEQTADLIENTAKEMLK